MFVNYHNKRLKDSPLEAVDFNENEAQLNNTTTQDQITTSVTSQSTKKIRTELYDSQ